MTSTWFVVWLACALGVVWIAVQDVGPATQAWLAVAALGSLLLLRVFKSSGLLRTFVLLLAAFVTIRYLGWRTFYSLPPIDSIGFAPGMLPDLDALHAIGLYFLGLFANLVPMSRPEARLPQHVENCSTVDVFITTCNESVEILQATLAAASGTWRSTIDRDPRPADRARDAHPPPGASCVCPGDG